ncbi:sugar transferase [Nodosilinea sp. LEGE 07088]|uniref:sugar transferase n=1 Tax=Nodosilinea sp. LEGE 07088 TaxID=2777968 RepID=UPI0018809F0A|nr:sugar transferase [Nodosilinea sp. LEGE 07088]MBE9140719.1 sugar transferase [Nodosilinea sp. LEGE 07088]
MLYSSLSALQVLDLDNDIAVPDNLWRAAIHPSVTSKFKRCLDILGALVGLSVTLIMLIPIAIAIQLDNPGPVFYSQMRCGYRGRPFRIWKFRSMVANADDLKPLVENQAEGLIFKNAQDPRITRVGSVLRRTSLDEFPQFWNVLKGDMSLVGTRPPTIDEVRRYERHHWQRLNVKPGLTGRWQAEGRSTIKDFEAIVKMDVDYQVQWSLGYDLTLIWRTVEAVVLSRGAC